MKTRVWFIAIAATFLFGLVGWTGLGQRSQRTTPQQTWEYKVIYVPGARNLSEKAMNDMGAQGGSL